jgi:acyl-CoA reductase-like NAD-dependent aldehyde dehydrogenase
MIDADILERFEERAAICEHDGKLLRVDAETLARFEVKKLGKVPKAVLERCKKTIVAIKEFT